MSGEMIRSFIAVHASEAASRELERLLTRLSPLARLRWVNRQQLHITLKFLGERSPELTVKVLDALSSITFNPFDIELDRAGVFPNMRSPRVLWLGCGRSSENPLSGGAKELAALAARVDEALSKIGIEREVRPFKAHMTLARCNGEPLPDALEKALADVPKFSWTCSSMSLMRSVLTPRGPIYTEMTTKR